MIYSNSQHWDFAAVVLILTCLKFCCIVSLFGNSIRTVLFRCESFITFGLSVGQERLLGFGTSACVPVSLFSNQSNGTCLLLPPMLECWMGFEFWAFLEDCIFWSCQVFSPGTRFLPYTLSNLKAMLSLHATWHVAFEKRSMCCTWFAHDCAPGHLSVCVKDCLRCSVERVNNLE